MNKDIIEDTSSAEITAIGRAKFPDISGDNFSHLLASKEGITKTHAFINAFGYPLVHRKISIRAGFMLRETITFLNTGIYDACISLASGFSMLTYCIANTTKNILNSNHQPIQFFDLYSKRCSFPVF